MGEVFLGNLMDFKALHFEKYKPQMNADERRFTATGNTDDADLTDFHGYDIRAYPRHPRNPCSRRRHQIFIKIKNIKIWRHPKAATIFPQ